MNILLIYAIIGSKHIFSVHKRLPGPPGEVKTSSFALSFHLANINAFKWRFADMLSGHMVSNDKLKLFFQISL